MSRLIQLGNPPIGVVLRRNASARRLSLRISRLDGRVTLTMPPRVPESEGIAFALERESWLRSHLSQIAPPEDAAAVGIGATIPVEGRHLSIVAAPGRRLQLLADSIALPAGPGQGARLKALLRTLARDRFAAASDRHAAALGRSYGKITLRDTRSRWGSCTAQGDLMYSWRLIMAPPAVLDYVAAHEVAHLAEMNHGPAFWRLVGQLCPEHQHHRHWLKSDGTALHRYRFGD